MRICESSLSGDATLRYFEWVRSVAHLDVRRPNDGRSMRTAVLVERALSGQPAASRTLYERFRSTVNQTASRLALSPADTEDLVQDAFARAFDNLHRLRDPAAFGEWVRSIVMRSASKRQRRHRTACRLGLVGANEPPVVLSVMSSTTPPEAAVELRQIYKALAELPSNAGDALVLHRVEGLTHRQVADRLGMSEPTVRRRIAQAQLMLEQTIGAQVPMTSISPELL